MPLGLRFPCPEEASGPVASPCPPALTPGRPLHLSARLCWTAGKCPGKRLQQTDGSWRPLGGVSGRLSGAGHQHFRLYKPQRGPRGTLPPPLPPDTSVKLRVGRAGARAPLMPPAAVPRENPERRAGIEAGERGAAKGTFTACRPHQEGIPHPEEPQGWVPGHLRTQRVGHRQRVAPGHSRCDSPVSRAGITLGAGGAQGGGVTVV